jgi:hypothetical protein
MRFLNAQPIGAASFAIFLAEIQQIAGRQHFVEMAGMRPHQNELMTFRVIEGQANEQKPITEINCPNLKRLPNPHVMSRWSLKWSQFKNLNHRKQVIENIGNDTFVQFPFFRHRETVDFQRNT